MIMEETSLLCHLTLHKILHKENKAGSWFYKVKWLDSWLPEEIMKKHFYQALNQWQNTENDTFPECTTSTNISESSEKTIPENTDIYSEVSDDILKTGESSDSNSVENESRYILVEENTSPCKENVVSNEVGPSLNKFETVLTEGKKTDGSVSIETENSESSSKVCHSSLQENQNESYNVVETMLFLCNLCSNSFSSHEEFSQHAEYCERERFLQSGDPVINAKCYKLVPTINNESVANLPAGDLILKEVPALNMVEQKPDTEKPNFGKSYRRKSPVELSKTVIHECLNCKMTFANIEYLNRHLTRCKNRSELNFKCETCGRGFTTKGSLELHVNAVHLKKKDFGCSICGKLFSKKHILKIHLDTHLDKRNYQCRTCGKTFVQKSNLTRHERIHKETNYGYICKYCGQVYSQNKYLQNHLASHFKKDESESSRPFE